MDRSLFSRMKQRPRLLLIAIAALTLLILAMNGYSLMRMDMTNVLPHLFYIPIILTAYFFPRRGVLFSCIVSILYFGISFLILPPVPWEFFLMSGRVVMFIVIGAVVSLLTLRLQESEQQFRGVTERSSDIILLTDREGRSIYASPSFSDILGTDVTQIVDRRPDEFIHPDDLPLLQAALQEIKKGKPSETITVRTRKSTGDYIFIEYSGVPIFSGGTFAGLQVIGRDITRRRMVEEAYRESSRRMAEIIDFLPDPTMVVDRTGAAVAWNHAMEKLSGIPAAEILGKGEAEYTRWIAGCTPPILIGFVLRGDTEGIKKAYPHVHFAGTTVRTEIRITRADGTGFNLWVSATPLIGRDGEVTGAIESLRDVTHQKKIEQALRESSAYLDAVINAMADPLFIKDRSFRFVKVNKSFCQFTGIPREDLMGRTDFDIFRTEEAAIFREKDEEVFATRQESENEEALTDSRGDLHTIVTKKTLYTNAAGEEFIVGVIRDISERKKTEEALQLALRKLNMLSSITRHDILNQLMALRGFLGLARAKETGAGISGYLQKGEQAAEAIQRQIEFTRNYENLGVTAPQWQDVAGLIMSAAAQLPLAGIRVEVNVPGLQVSADPLISKVFYNLLENTLRHGGPVTTVSLSAQEEADGMTLTYRDDGTGIADQDRQQLFRKGFGKHTGLGLFLSREILSITGITIAETGTAGTGVRFEIHVPRGAYRIVPPS